MRNSYRRNKEKSEKGLKINNFYYFCSDLHISKGGETCLNSKVGIFMPSPHYIRTGGFAPVRCINVLAAFAGVSQRVSGITFFYFSVPHEFNHLKTKAMDRRVKFNTTTKFELAQEELKSLYTLMSLVQYPYDCDPEYRDYNLIRRLRNDFHRFNIEIKKACESDPNNLVLSQIRNFVQRHYGYLKKVSKPFAENNGE